MGIGASAGALTALKTFFELVPEKTGMAFVVVVHLAPDQKSMLAELMQPHVKLPVQQVIETVPLEADHVYVIPPNANLDTIDTHLRLSQLEESRRMRAPIDHFFRTLARTHDGHAIGVILTGTGSDGALGIKEIKAQGGLTIVQEPSEAEYDGMPQSAIATGMVDLVLPLRQIPDALVGIERTQPRLEAIRGDGDDIADEERQLLHRIFAQIRARTGRDFSRYKRSTILRRIVRRMQLAHVEDLGSYIAILRQKPDETIALADDLLITVTSFFRDSEVYQRLEQEVVPSLFTGKGADEPLRVWSVGCATGEEAYSLAIVLLEQVARREGTPRIQVFASDLHETSLQRAREGFYPGDIEADVSAERLRRFFDKVEGGYRIRKEVRELVVFAPHNLLGDPPFSRIDLIMCRNVLIYLQREIQRDIIDLFHYALGPEGWMVLGLSETSDESELFRTVHKALGIYQKRNGPVVEPRLPVFLRAGGKQHLGGDLRQRGSEGVSYGSVQQRLLEKHAPPSILVRDDDRIVYSSESAGRYLVHPGGEPTSNVFRVLRQELQVELRAALQAARNHERVRTRPVAMQIDGRDAMVALQVRPALDEIGAGCTLVMFDEWAAGQQPWPSPGDVEDAAASGNSRNATSDLELARQRLQAIIEEYETSQEEMKAANEELQSTNEELRSTMEELETSKEELQSVNEELQTVNQENRHKVEELAQLNSDLQNLLAATDIATLFLDRELRIMRFTPKVVELINVRVTDRGRSLADITHRLGYDRLLDDARGVLANLVPIEREVQDKEGRWFLVRVRPYRTMEDHIGGIVMTFVDITTRRIMELALRESEGQYRVLVEATSQDVWEATTEGMAKNALSGRRIYAGQAPEEWLAQSWIDSIHPEDREDVRQRWGAAVAAGASIDIDFRLKALDGSWRWTNVRGVPIRNDNGQVVKWVAMNLDINERRNAEQALRESDRRKEEFLAVLAHELRNPLAALCSSVAILGVDASQPTLQTTRAIMERQLKQIVRLIDDLIDVNRIGRGRLELRWGLVDVAELVRQALDTAGVADGCGRHVSVAVSRERLLVRADSARLLQVFGNLISNAMKFTSNGDSIRIEVERQGSDAVITVRDSGAGIPADRLEWIFEPFTQIDRQHDRGGLGLGLSLVRRLVELHGGRVAAASDGIGMGTAFTVHLPLVVGADVPARHQEAAAPAVSGMRILIVDDNRDFADPMAMLLRGYGNEVRTAYDGEQAMLEAEEFQPDAALLDLGLPKVDGHGVARWIRAQPWGKPTLLIAVTGLSDRGRGSSQAPFDHRFVKPLDLAKLERLLCEFQALCNRSSG